MTIGFAGRRKGCGVRFADTLQAEGQDVRSVENGGMNDLDIGDLPCGKLWYRRSPGPYIRD